jgi:hypothetical protein
MSKTKIEFFLTNLNSIYVVAPFCKRLNEYGFEANLAIDELFWKISFGEHFNVNKAINLADKFNVPLHLKLNYDVDIAVTQWIPSYAQFALYKNLKAKITYGIVINKNTEFSYQKELNEIDLFFVHGDFQKENLLSYNINKDRIFKIGYPKLEYQKDLNNNQNLRELYNLKDEKKIIAYLPTWDEYNSIDSLIDALDVLSDTYYILAKLHPLTYTIPEKKEQLNLIKNSNIILIDENIPIKDIAQCCDLAISDLKSGVTEDLIYFNSSLPIITFSKEKYLNLYYDVCHKIGKIVSNEVQLYKAISSIKIRDNKELQEYFFDISTNESLIKLKNIKLKKISKIYDNKLEINILKDRLENTYRNLKK